jgi:hypothetical protein
MLKGIMLNGSRRNSRRLHAAWMMVVDGEVAAFGESMDSYPSDEEFWSSVKNLENILLSFLIR